MSNPDDAYRGRRAYSYIRFSSVGQIGNDSLRRQWTNAVRYAERLGLVIDETTTLRDLALSAYKGAHRQRGAMNVLLDAIESGHIPADSVLLVEAVDRISREHPLDAMDLCQRVLRSGIEIHTVEDGYRYSRESIQRDGLARLAGKIDAANQYSHRLAMRARETWINKKEQAREEGKATSKMLPGWLRRVDDGFEVIPDRGAVVVRIFTESANGIGADTIARRLNEDNVPVFDRAGQGITSTSKSDGWHGSYIKRILKHRAVLGEYQPGKGDKSTNTDRDPDGPVILGYYPVINRMTEDLFNRAAAARRSRRTASGRGRGGRKGHQVANLFTGLCVCERCEGPLHFVRKGPGGRATSTVRSYNYLVCYNASRSNGCDDRTHHSYNQIETAILDLLASSVLFERGTLDPEPSDAVQAVQAELATLDREIEEREAQVAALWAELARKPSPYGRAAIDSVEAEIEERKARREELSEQVAVERGTEPVSSHLDAVRDLRALASSETPEGYEARARLAVALREIIDVIIFTPDRKPTVIVGAGAMTFVIEKGEATRLMIHNGEQSIYVGEKKASKPFPTPAYLLRHMEKEDRIHPGRRRNVLRRLHAAIKENA